jgi:hypothetical protein
MYWDDYISHPWQLRILLKTATDYDGNQPLTMRQTSRSNCPSLNELLNIDRLPDSGKDRHEIDLFSLF